MQGTHVECRSDVFRWVYDDKDTPEIVKIFIDAIRANGMYSAGFPIGKSWLIQAQIEENGEPRCLIAHFTECWTLDQHIRGRILWLEAKALPTLPWLTRSSLSPREDTSLTNTLELRVPGSSLEASATPDTAAVTKDCKLGSLSRDLASLTKPRFLLLSAGVYFYFIDGNKPIMDIDLGRELLQEFLMCTSIPPPPPVYQYHHWRPR